MFWQSTTMKYFNRRNFCKRNFRDFANFCCFRENWSCEITMNLKFAKVYLAKFRENFYSLRFDLNSEISRVFFLAKVYTIKIDIMTSISYILFHRSTGCNMADHWNLYWSFTFICYHICLRIYKNKT